MDRTTGTPLGFTLLLALAVGFVWALSGPHHLLGTGGDGGTQLLASSRVSQADLDAAQAEPALEWPDQMPDPLTDYIGRRVSAFGLRVTSVDADEGFWVQSGGRRAWVQIETAAESPYTVRPGDTVSFSGRVLPHDPDFPNGIFMCADRQSSAAEIARTPTHFAIRVDALSFGVG
jgi:hypothetical protein